MPVVATSVVIWLLEFAQTFDMMAGMVAFAVVLKLVEGWFAPVPSGTVGSVRVTLTTGSPVNSRDDGITPRVSEPVRVKETLDNYCLLIQPLVKLAFADPVYRLRGVRYSHGLSLYTNGIPPTPLKL